MTCRRHVQKSVGLCFFQSFNAFFGDFWPFFIAFRCAFICFFSAFGWRFAFFAAARDRGVERAVA